MPAPQVAELTFYYTRTIVYQAIRDADQCPVVVKLQQDYPTLSELLQFRNQYLINAMCDFSKTPAKTALTLTPKKHTLEQSV